MINILEEHDLDSFVTTMIEEIIANAGRINYMKKQEKSKRVIYDSMKDIFMSVITPLKTTKECFETLKNLYEKKDPTKNRALKNNLRNMKMERDETITSLFTNI